MKKDLKNKKTPVRSEISKWLLRLGLSAAIIVKIMMLMGCENIIYRDIYLPVHPDLQKALTWVNETGENGRHLALANHTDDLIPFENLDWAIQGDRTFRQLATHALLDAWIDTYQNNRGEWNEAAWKRIVGGAVNGNNSHFDPVLELPLIISKGAEQYNAVKNPLGEYMRSRKKQRAV